MGNALHMCQLELHRNAKCYGSQNSGLMCRVKSFDIKSRICLSVPQTLGLCQCISKTQAFVAHLGEYEIGGAVDDAGHPLDTIARQAFAQRLDDGNAHRHRTFKRHHDASGVRHGKYFIAIFGQQRFISGYHMFAIGNGPQHQVFGHCGATDDFHHNFHVRMVHYLKRVGYYRCGIANQLSCALQVAGTHHGDFNATARTAFDFFLVSTQHIERATTYGANAQQAYLNRFHKING